MPNDRYTDRSRHYDSDDYYDDYERDYPSRYSTPDDRGRGRNDYYRDEDYHDAPRRRSRDYDDRGDSYRDRYDTPPQRRRRVDDRPEPTRRDDGEDRRRSADDAQRRPKRRPSPAADETDRKRPAERPRLKETPKDAPKPKPKPEKKPKQKKPRKPLRETGIVKFLCNKNFHSVLGVALAFLGIYLVACIISFFSSGAADQSLVHSLSPQQMVESGAQVKNVGGPLGATLAQSLIVEGLGLGALAGVVWLVIIGVALMLGKPLHFWSRTFKALLVAIALSVVLGFISLQFGMTTNLGGEHGRYVNLVLLSYIDWIGTILVSLLLIIAVIYVYLTDLTKVWNKYVEIRNARRDKAEQERKEREDERRRISGSLQTDLEGDDTEPEEEEEPDSEPEEPEVPDSGIGRMFRGSIMGKDVGFGEVPDDEYDHRDEYEIPQPVAAAPATEVPVAVATAVAPAEAAVGTEQGAEDVQLQVETNTIEAANPRVASAVAEQGAYDPTADLSRYHKPPVSLLNQIPEHESVDQEEMEENKERIIKTLGDYGIGISSIKATVGPTVTLYEIVPAEGVRIAKIKGLEDDMAMSLAALGIRIIAPIPGKGTIGIEVPNKEPQIVSIHKVLASKKFQESTAQLPMALGVTISKEVYIADLAKMPHLLVAGTTGTGKSVGLNAIIASLLYKKHPAELKFVFIDPKFVELGLYSVLRNHFLAMLPDEEEAVVTQMDKVLPVLNSLCIEMDSRYMLLRDANVRTITEYNERFTQRRLNPEKGHRFLPYIVLVVDEFADLRDQVGKEIEKPIGRIAQKARAVGIHLILATQRPSTTVVTGLIKANFPGRIAFRVAQMVDSKTILDRTGAQHLIGRGDLLFSHNGSLERLQCAFIDTPEVEAICNHIAGQPGYPVPYFLPDPDMEGGDGGSGSGPVSLSDRDPLFEEVAEIVVTSGVASTSSVQRRYSIGYNRAGKIMDQLEMAGIVGPATGGKPRQVLVDIMQLRDKLNALE